jgi:hypothetical protein
LRLLGGVMKTMRWTTSPVLRWLALLLLCAAYLQGGLNKAMDFGSAIAEMNHFGVSPAGPLAVAVIVLELGASALVLTGFHRWLGALALARVHAVRHLRRAALLADAGGAGALHGRQLVLRAPGPGRRLPAGGLARPEGARA